MPVSNTLHRIRTGQYYNMSQTIKHCSLDLLTILMVNLLVTYGTNALTIIVLIIFNNFLTKLSRSAVNKINCTNFIQHRKDIKYLKHLITTYPTVFICTLTSLYLLWILFMLLLCGDIEVNPGPYEHTITSDDLVDSIPNSLDLILENSISIAHLNVQSINNKLDIIQAELGGFDIITINSKRNRVR